MPENDSTPIGSALDAEKTAPAPKPPAAATPQAKAETPAAAGAHLAQQEAAAPASDSSTEPEQSVEQAQFPSLKGEPEVEVDKRSPDHDGPTSKFVKTFVVLGEIGEGDEPTRDLHERNQLVVLEEAVQRGMHPQGEARFVEKSEERARRSVSTSLTYEVDVIPAAVDDEPNDAVVPSKVLGEQQTD